MELLRVIADQLPVQILGWFPPRTEGRDKTMVDKFIIALDGNSFSEAPIITKLMNMSQANV